MKMKLFFIVIITLIYSNLIFAKNKENPVVTLPDFMSENSFSIPENKMSQSLFKIKANKTITKVPLVIVLHGGNGQMETDSARKTAISYLSVWRSFVETGKVVAISASSTWGWNYNGMAEVKNMIKYAKENPEFNIDEDKIFIWGQSMGGHGAWRIGLWLDNSIAGIIPVCGGYDFGDYLKSYRNLPIYHIQGESDPLYNLKDIALKNAAWFKGKDYDYQFYLMKGGHELFEAKIPDIITWMNQHPKIHDPDVLERNWNAVFIVGWNPVLFNSNKQEVPGRPDLDPMPISKNYWFDIIELTKTVMGEPTSYRIERVLKDTNLVFNLTSININKIKIDISKDLQSKVLIYKVNWNGVEIIAKLENDALTLSK